MTDDDIRFIRATVISIGQMAARAYQEKKRLNADQLVMIFSGANNIVMTLDGTFDAVKLPPKEHTH